MKKFNDLHLILYARASSVAVPQGLLQQTKPNQRYISLLPISIVVIGLNAINGDVVIYKPKPSVNKTWTKIFIIK